VTEAEWLVSGDPELMLDWLASRVSPRRLRLFACACSRLNWEDLPDQRFHAVILIGERLADGPVAKAELDVVQLGFERAVEDLYQEDIPTSVPRQLLFPMFTSSDAQECAALAAYQGQFSPSGFEGIEVELTHDQADILRDVAGNPFRAVRFEQR
jgi:hypothetical protein